MGSERQHGGNWRPGGEDAWAVYCGNSVDERNMEGEKVAEDEGETDD